MLLLRPYLFFIFLIFFFTSSFALESSWSNSNESKVRIISSLSNVGNSEKFYLGLEYKLNEEWKTYWKSPGDGGFPQEISWENSKNIESLELLWPKPERFGILDLNSLGYSEHVIFPLSIKPKDLSKPVEIFLDINYLTCKEICIPNNVKLDLVIPSGLSALTEHSHNIEKFLSYVPDSNQKISFINEIEVKGFVDNKNITIILEADSLEQLKKPDVFIHSEKGLPVIIPSIAISANSKKLKANFIFDKKLIKEKNINIDFIITNKNKSFEVKKILEIQELQNYNFQNFFNPIILLIAFLGGLILNGMPCVFPVLSLKLITLLKNIKEPYLIRRSFINTAFGIITSFGLLAISLIILRSLGINIGWGIQFQQPIFLMFISLVLILFSLNLFGFYEISLPYSVNNNFISSILKNSFAKDFFNGFFATLLATPCSAPFVGTAVTFAFTQSSFMLFLVFISMGFGMASPYILISFFPKLLIFLPRPGPWMKYLKYILATLLLITLAWIINILLSHFNIYFLLIAILLFILSFIIIYFSKYKISGLIISIIIFFNLINLSFLKMSNITMDETWLDFNEVDITKLLENKEIVFVDITADWCATCQYNKINVINSNKISEAFLKYKVIKIKGDWTKPNNKILEYLKKNNKFGIPFNIFYSRKYPEGIVLSELLTSREIMSVLKKIE